MSSKPYRVIFDTSLINNEKSIDTFLGNREELEQFSQRSTIIIPDIVIEEIKRHKIKYLKSKRDSFLYNPFKRLIKTKDEDIKTFDIEQYVETILDNETLPFSLIYLTNPSEVLEKMRHLSINNLPPFNENTDKGFKDAYIYFTVMEYKQNVKDGTIFFAAKDGRLSEAFNNSEIKVIQNFKEFMKYNTDYFYGSYFIEKLQEELNEKEVSPEYTDFWLNSQGNWILKLSLQENIWLIEVDFSSKDLLSIIDGKFSNKIDKLVDSKSFISTHGAISDLEQYLPYFSNQQIQTLIQAAIENDQIYRICQDEDVREFFTNLYKDRYISLDDTVKKRFEEMFINQEEEDSEKFDIPFD